MSIKDRLIQFVLRGKDELSPAAEKSEAALDSLRQEAEQLGQALDQAKGAQGLALALRQTERAVEQTERSLVQADLQIRELRDALNKSPEGAGLQQSLKEAEREARKLQRGLDTLRTSLGDQQQAAKAAGIDTDKLGDEQQRLAADVDKAKKALAENSSQLKAAQREQNAAARAAAEHASRQGEVSQALEGGAKKLVAFVAAYASVNAVLGLVQRGLRTVAQGIRAVATSGSEEQQALGQLEAALASTGRQAEFTTQQLQNMADSLEDSSMLNAEQIQSAQARLLSYTDVAATEFPRAMQIIIDQQERLGISVEQSAEIVGRALQSPSEAIATLGRQGFKLEDGQKRLLKQLEATGKTAEAQAIIMDMLTEAYGGSAAAAKLGTFQGLLKTIDKQIGDFTKRVKNAGAFEFMQRKLLELSNYLDEMANDGRLDALAEALSAAFIDAAERAEEFAKKLLEVDFKTLTDDATRWLDNFGEKLDTTGRWITLISAPFRGLLNLVTGGISLIGMAFTGLVTASLAGMSLLAKAIPNAFGGQQIVKGLESARDTAAGMFQALAGQVAQDGRDIAATWNSVAKSAEDSAARQVEAVRRASGENKRLMEKTGNDIMSFFRSNIASLENALAAISFAETAAELDEVEAGLYKANLEAEEMVKALAALDQQRAFVTVGEGATTAASKIAKLRLEQQRLEAEYRAGVKTLEEWQQGHNEAAVAIRELESESGKAAITTQALGKELKTLADVQRAISDAKTDRDIAAANAALKRMLDTGIIDGAQYNAEMKRSTDRLKEIKSAIEGSKKAQDEKNNSDRDAIVTSEDLRRESGKRMEEERRASGEAMELQRKQSSDAQSGVAAMGGFVDSVMGAARGGVSALSRAALEAFDRLRGISTAAPSIDTSGLDATRRSLEQVSKALEEVEYAVLRSSSGSLTKWANETQRDSLKTQQAFLSQKSALQSLMDDYERGSISAQRFVRRATSMRSAMSLLDESDLSGLSSAIEAANQRMEQMAKSTRSTLEGLQDELDNLQGRTEDIERRRFASRRRELEAQMAEANAQGDSQAVANAARALGMLRQIESETAQQRQREEQQKRIDAQQQPQGAAPQQAQAPGKVIRLEVPGRQAVDVAVSSDTDETNLLGILEQAGLRAL
ncbi:phage tail length tape measure family protein [Stutzerimonas nitrititolerans]|uniref:phage tail length tape measure family protein n=1 Tax=Stutzerimonas nitrititolerans TaxID=2482751 RepID=UPI00289C17D1|nr:phage tail length tape measure family protein [Stutzerimonas nitrititolerans]